MTEEQNRASRSQRAQGGESYRQLFNRLRVTVVRHEALRIRCVSHDQMVWEGRVCVTHNVAQRRSIVLGKLRLS